MLVLYLDSSMLNHKQQFLSILTKLMKFRLAWGTSRCQPISLKFYSLALSIIEHLLRGKPFEISNFIFFPYTALHPNKHGVGYVEQLRPMG